MTNTSHSDFEQAAHVSRLETRKKISDWHFDCRCQMGFAFEQVLYDLWQEGYPLSRQQIIEEQTHEKAEVTDTEQEQQGSDPEHQAVMAELKQVVRKQNSEFEITSLPLEDNYPDSFVVRSHEVLNIQGTDGIVMQFPVLCLNQYSLRYQDSEESPCDLSYSSSGAVIFGQPRTADFFTGNGTLDNVMVTFRPEDALYKKASESMTGLKEQLRNILDVLVQQGLIVKGPAREETPVARKIFII